MSRFLFSTEKWRMTCLYSTEVGRLAQQRGAHGAQTRVSRKTWPSFQFLANHRGWECAQEHSPCACTEQKILIHNLHWESAAESWNTDPGTRLKTWRAFSAPHRNQPLRFYYTPGGGIRPSYKAKRASRRAEVAAVHQDASLPRGPRWGRIKSTVA